MPNIFDYKNRAEIFAWMVLSRNGYNYALSDVEDACKFLDHPELDETDTSNFHLWAEPYTRRCYCGAVGYTDKGRFYAVRPSESHIQLMQKINKDYRSRFGEPYEGKNKIHMNKSTGDDEDDEGKAKQV